MLACVNLPFTSTYSANRGKPLPLSDGATISLITCGGGDELYAAYGHSAIRVRDNRKGLDIVFNYGTFDFATPFFYPKFMNGTLDYMLSTCTFSNFMFEYRYTGRSVRESPMILSSSEMQDLWFRLIENCEGDNRYYRYDFFYDNCATRIRDILFAVKGLQKDDYLRICPDTTFRRCIHQYVGPEEWAAEGIDLLLGVRTEDEVSAWTLAFLPDYLEVLLRRTGIVGESTEILASRPRKEPTAGEAVWTWICATVLSPIGASLLVLLTVCIMTLVERKRGSRFVALDVALWSGISVLSIIMWYMWIVSEIRICSYNYNVLWASILYLPAVVLLVRGRGEGRWSVWLAKANVFLALVYWLLGVMGVQYALPMGIILSIALTVRNVALISRHA